MRSFLSDIADRPDERWTLINHRTGRVVATAVETAFDSPSRRRGLLGRERLANGVALIIAPCSSIHMFFMKFPIDVLFVARDGRVVKICRRLRPWRIAAAPGAFAAVEMPVGAIDASATLSDDHLELRAGPAV